MGFRENLREELTYHGILIKELAYASGVNKRALDTYLRTNPCMPPADIAVKIARALGVTVEYLVTGENPSMPQDIRLIARNLFKLNEKDRRVVSIMVDALLERIKSE